MTTRTIVVTGAGGVLGSAVVEAAVRTGATVARIDLATLTGGEADHGGVDLTDLAQTQAVMAAIKAQTGRFDVLVNVAGGFRWQTLEDGELSAWDAMFAINLKTAATASKVALPLLLQSGDGRIINVGAQGAMQAGAGMGAYAAAKAGVAKLTESLAAELVGRGVTVNAVLPSIIDTPANRADMPDADPATWVRPADLAAVILFLASAEARAVTGALIPVRGGV